MMVRERRGFGYVMAPCPNCGGTGTEVDMELVCCGRYLDTGECCAAKYGEANLIVEQSEQQCRQCGGMGELEL